MKSQDASFKNCFFELKLFNTYIILSYFFNLTFQDQKTRLQRHFDGFKFLSNKSISPGMKTKNYLLSIGFTIVIMFFSVVHYSFPGFFSIMNDFYTLIPPGTIICKLGYSLESLWSGDMSRCKCHPET